MIPCRCPDPVCFASHHRTVRRLADTGIQLPPSSPADYWSDEDLAEWRRRLGEANTPAAQARHMKREIRRLLSRRARLRLWWHARIDHAAIWLLDHGRERTAIALWRATRLW